MPDPDAAQQSHGAAATRRVVAVLNVSPAFEAAIRDAARAAAQEAASVQIGAEPTLAAREAVSEHVRTKVRAAAREFLRTETEHVGAEAPPAVPGAQTPARRSMTPHGRARPGTPRLPRGAGRLGAAQPGCE